jgi:hypothetical protein
MQPLKLRPFNCSSWSYNNTDKRSTSEKASLSNVRHQHFNGTSMKFLGFAYLAILLGVSQLMQVPDFPDHE